MGVKYAQKVGFNLNFLQKVKFMESLCLNYSGNSKSTDRIKYTTQIPCPCRFWNTPYLIWLLLISPSDGLSKFKYIWQFWIFGQSLLKIKKYQMYANFDRPPLGLIKSNQLRKGVFRKGHEQGIRVVYFILSVDLLFRE